MKLNEFFSAWKEKCGRRREIRVNLKNNIYTSINQSDVIKMVSKTARLSETE